MTISKEKHETKNAHKKELFVIVVLVVTVLVVIILVIDFFMDLMKIIVKRLLSDINLLVTP